jgi:hypothetical protein
VFQLRAQSEEHVFLQLDLVFDERTEEMVVEPGRQESKRGCGTHCIVRKAVAKAPHHLLPR